MYFIALFQTKNGKTPHCPLAHLGLMGYTVSMGTARVTKQADERGRISLGSKYANRMFLVETENDMIIVRPARVVPEREAWLYENPEALKRVRTGLAQAKKGVFAKTPSLDEARRLATEIESE